MPAAQPTRVTSHHTHAVHKFLETFTADPFRVARGRGGRGGMSVLHAHDMHNMHMHMHMDMGARHHVLGCVGPFCIHLSLSPLYANR